MTTTPSKSIIGTGGQVLADFPSLARSMPTKDESPPPASKYVLESLQHWAICAATGRSMKDVPVCLVCQVPDHEKMYGENTSTEDKKEELIMKTRLPCGHVYHTGCISLWLSCNCTCPTCRYELPADDFLFEMGREERMRSYNISNKTLEPPPEDALVPQEGLRQKILQQLDIITSTTPSTHWKKQGAATISRATARTGSTKDLGITNNASNNTILRVKSANTIIASSA